MHRKPKTFLKELQQLGLKKTQFKIQRGLWSPKFTVRKEAKKATNMNPLLWKEKEIQRVEPRDQKVNLRAKENS